MPKSWSNKRERQYEHIKRSAKGSGRSSRTAKRIAAATVNKTRRQKGETRAGGRSRLCYHGVPELKDGEHQKVGRMRINLTFRGAL